MYLNIELNDRIFNDIDAYCKANNLDVNEYLVGIISEKHSINKFGDLNELLPKVVEETKVEVKRRGRPKKVKTEEVVNAKEKSTLKAEKDETPVKEGHTLTTVFTIEEKKTEIAEDNPDEVKPKSVVKRKRTLKAL